MCHIYIYISLYLYLDVGYSQTSLHLEITFLKWNSEPNIFIIPNKEKQGNPNLFTYNEMLHRKKVAYLSMFKYKSILPTCTSHVQCIVNIFQSTVYFDLFIMFFSQASPKKIRGKSSLFSLLIDIMKLQTQKKYPEVNPEGLKTALLVHCILAHLYIH